MLVSERAYGRQGFDELLLRFHGHPVRNPQRESYSPGERYLAWHERQVFKSPGRGAA